MTPGPIVSLFVDPDRTKHFEVASMDINNKNKIHIFFKVSDKTHYIEFNSDSNCSPTYDVKEWKEGTLPMNLPLDSSGHLWTTNKLTTTSSSSIYKCAKPCVPGANETSLPYSSLSSENTSISSISSSDTDALWGISDISGTQIYKKTMNDSSGTLFTTNIENMLDIYASNEELWGIYKDGLNKKIKTAKKPISTTIEFNDLCTASQNQKVIETVVVENVPIGKPFHLLVTITPKRIDVYLDGLLKTTVILVGKRNHEIEQKQIRFFGSSSKIDGIVSHFRYIPFSVDMETLRKLVKSDSRNETWLSKCVG